jgi:hypothetical protein
MSPDEKEKIKKLVRELSQCVNAALTDSNDVKDASRHRGRGYKWICCLLSLPILRKKRTLLSSKGRCFPRRRSVRRSVPQDSAAELVN